VVNYSTVVYWNLSALIFSRPFHVIYDNDVDWPPLGFEFEAKLLLNGGKQGRLVGCRLFGRPVQLDVKGAGQSALVSNNVLDVAPRKTSRFDMDIAPALRCPGVI